MARTQNLQRIMRKYYSLSIVFCCTLLMIGGAFAAQAPSSLKIRQTYLEYPNLTIYADLTDASNLPLAPHENDKMSVSLGNKMFDVKSIDVFSKQKDGIATVFVIDVSASIRPERFKELKNTISAWIKQMGANDRAAILTFGDSVKVVQEFTPEQKILLYSLQTLNADGVNTQLNSGLISALNLSRIKSAELPQRRMILLCSDGIDDTPSGATSEEVRDSILIDPIPIYSIFFDAIRMPAADRKNALKTIGEFSRRSGGQIYDAKTSPFSKTFKEITKTLDGTLALHVDLKEFTADGSAKRLNLEFSNSTVSLSDGIDVRLLAKNIKVPEEKESKIQSWIKKIEGLSMSEKMILGVCVLLFLCVVIYLLVKRKKKRRKSLEKSENVEAPVTKGVSSLSGSTVNIRGNNEQGHTAVIKPQKPTGPAINIELSVTGTSSNVETYLITVSDRIFLGRNSGPSVFGIPGDGTISAKHCELIFSSGKLFVLDLKSTNGTMVNGVPIQGTHPLNDGDRLTLGKTDLRLRIKGVQ